ncbi:MAG: oxidoreductase [Gemmatimonadetes bacterium]|nr:oxidoreductase [Gemmatimonadota bacterium]|tara:strand:+ start:1359 stop:2171 length:813 start_codon:yes stop_codon:yes gene_type:complete
MNLELNGTVAVVVGAANGIGRAVADGFAAEGAFVACVDRDERIEEVAAEIGDTHDTRTAGFSADVTDYQGLCALPKLIASALGPHDHLVCTAGMGSGKFGFPFWNLDPKDWEQTLQVNLTGTVNVAHAFTPAMVHRRRGGFLFYASVAGQIGSQTDPPYSASKAGVINFSQCAARDLGPYGVRVNCLCPGMVKTDLNEGVWKAWCETEEGQQNPQTYDEWAEEKIKRVVPLGEWQEPEDMAAMSVFLASPRARHITGQTINVDGGFVMHS